MSLNEVMIEGGLNHPHRGHLTRMSVATLSTEQLVFLYDRGYLDFERPGCYVELLSAIPGEWTT